LGYRCCRFGTASEEAANLEIAVNKHWFDLVIIM